ncbi:MAG TPA: GNAT family N-acetyltransferase [bacterium]|nr:GNAT family N-acetyltransferase [bacterium]
MLETAIAEIFKNLPTLETEHLLLRSMKLSDAEDMFDYAADEQVTRYLTWTPHQSVDDSRKFLEYVLSRYDKGEPENWGMELKESSTFIGTCGFMEIIREHNRAEIGYAMSRSYWGKGLMTEAVKAAINFGFETLGLNRIQARCDVPNIGSARVMEKAGMQYEGTLRQWDLIKGEYRDVKLYAVLKNARTYLI